MIFAGILFGVIILWAVLIVVAAGVDDVNRRDPDLDP